MTPSSFKRSWLLLTGLLAVLVATQTVVSAPPVPDPVLHLVSIEPFQSGEKQLTRYNYDVLNKAEYPASLFVAAPDLPPCGKITRASRTWVDFYDQRGKRLNGFCELSKPSELGSIWFALEAGVIPPSYVYIELTDRRTNTKYKSNLADTSQ